MKKLEISKEFYRKLANKSLDLCKFGSYGEIIPDGDICYKLDSSIKYCFLCDTAPTCFLENRGKETIQLLEELSKRQPNVLLSNFPHTILTYRGEYIGNIQKYYKDYKSLETLIEERELSIDELKLLLHSMLDALEELGRNGIIFLDQHDGNVMFNGSNSKIIDFDTPGYTLFDRHSFSNYEAFYENLISTYVLLKPNIENEPILNYKGLSNYIDSLEEQETIFSDRKMKDLIK